LDAETEIDPLAAWDAALDVFGSATVAAPAASSGSGRGGRSTAGASEAPELSSPPAKAPRSAGGRGGGGGCGGGRGAGKRAAPPAPPSLPGSTPPSKKQKTGKLDNIVPAIKAEFTDFCKTLSESKLTADALDKGITGWGKRKGALMAAQRLTEIDDLQDTINEAKKLHKVLATLGDIQNNGPDLMSAYAHLDKYIHDLPLDLFGCLPVSVVSLSMKARSQIQGNTHQFPPLVFRLLHDVVSEVSSGR
jgi:hypothetical protein